MPITVKHGASITGVADLSFKSGQGEYRKWKQEYEQRERQFAMQMALGAVGTIGSLGLGLMNFGLKSKMAQAGMAQRQQAAKAKLAGNMNQSVANAAKFQAMTNVIGDDGLLGGMDAKAFSGLGVKGQESYLDLHQKVFDAEAIARWENSPETIDRKVQSAFNTQDAERRYRGDLHQKFATAIRQGGDDGKYFAQVNPKTGLMNFPNDPQLQKAYDYHINKINQSRLGYTDPRTNFGDNSIDNGDGTRWWMDPENKKAPVLLDSGKGAGGGRAGRSKLPSTDTPAADRTVGEQAEYLKLVKTEEEYQRSTSQVDEVARIDYEDEKDRIAEEISASRAAERLKPGSDTGQIADLEAQLAAHRKTMPRNVPAAELRKNAENNVYRDHGLRPNTPGWQSSAESDASNLNSTIKNYNDAVQLRQNDPEQFTRVFGPHGDTHLKAMESYIQELQGNQEERGRLRGIDERRLGGQEEPPPLIRRPPADQEPSAKREEATGTVASRLPATRETKKVTPLYQATNPKGVGTPGAFEALEQLGQETNDYLTAYLQEGRKGDLAREQAMRVNRGKWSKDYKKPLLHGFPSEFTKPDTPLSGAQKLEAARDSQVRAARAIAQAADRWTKEGPASISNIPMPTRDEFTKMVADGLVKAGDVLLSRDRKTGKTVFKHVSQSMIDSVTSLDDLMRSGPGPSQPQRSSFQPPPSPF